MNFPKIVCGLLLFTALASCGGGGGGGSSDDSANALPEEDLRQQFVEYFGTEGNIWKPSSDPISSGAGNLVVLLSPKYTTRFDTCELTLIDGSTAQLLCIDFEEWTQIPFSCFSNGGRQTWRANFGCDDAALVEVTCRDATQEVVFTVDGPAVSAVCSRFG
ncbi:MAG: hypothetical protein KDD70_01940 [Bdellovibrionales bacterium]|nr:hypothetical protein [Bdellovibrionales bacterium]